MNETVKKFRFGVLSPGAPSAAEWRLHVQRCESLGYSSLLVPDHLNQQWAPLIALTDAAKWTENLTLGTLMLAVDLRNPVVLFKELATLSHLVSGDLEIGVGAGWLKSDFSNAGITLDPPSTRIARLEEAITILKALAMSGTITTSGEHYQINDAGGYPAFPIGKVVRWALGGGGKKMLSVAQRHADIVSLSANMSHSERNAKFGESATLLKFYERAKWLDALPGTRNNVERQCLALACSVTSNRDRYARLVLTRMFDLDPAVALESPMVLVGTVDEISGALIRNRKELGINYWVIPAASMEMFAPVVHSLQGY